MHIFDSEESAARSNILRLVTHAMKIQGFSFGYKQSSGLEFRLVFLSFKSSVRHTVSQLLVDQFSKTFDSHYNQDKMKSVPIF